MQSSANSTAGNAAKTRRRPKWQICIFRRRIPVRRLHIMSKLSSRDIQVFAAGALALMGFHSLVVTPYYIFVSKSLALTAGALFSALPLLIGIAMLKRNERALFWAQIYLWLCFLGALIGISFAMASDKPVPEHSHWWRDMSELLTPVILIWLLKESHSARFDQTPNKKE